MRIIIFGAPGVGKGTQAKVLSTKLHIPHISTGDILRSAVRKETPLGIKIKEIMDQGELVPEDLMAQLIDEVLNGKKTEKGFILDGYPRTIHQAEILEKILNKLDGSPSPTVLYLLANDDLIIKRLSQRRACSACGNIVNLNYIEDPALCPYCGSSNTFVKRKDDEVDIIRNRLKVYHETTEPVLDFYRGKTTVLEIDAIQPVEDVTADILSKLHQAG